MLTSVSNKDLLLCRLSTNLSSSLACQNSYPVHHNFSNSLLFSIAIFHQNPPKKLLQAWKPLKIDFFPPTSFSNNHGQKSRDTCISGRFPINTGPTPPLSPQSMLDACIQNFFRVSTLHRVGGGRTARKFRKGCTVLWGNPEWQKNTNIALLSQVCLSMIVVCAELYRL